MLTSAERIAFLLLVLVCGALAFSGFRRIVRVVRRGRPASRGDRLPGRFVRALVEVALQKPIFKARPLISLLHVFLFFGFSFYVLVNVNDVLEAYLAGWTTLHGWPLARAFNLVSDLSSVGVLLAMVLFLVRRFALRPPVLESNPNVVLHPAVAAGGVRRDSLIVGVFILLHVGARWLGTVFHLAQSGEADPWLPTANLAAPLFGTWSAGALDAGIHLCWWLAMGLIVLFLPYFPRSKHLHLMAAPINLALSRQEPRGRSEPVSNPASPGARTAADLRWPQLLDPYACIMCNRCQEVCPAHASGAPLSPAALEINKRYGLTEHGGALASGKPVPALLESAISPDAVWSCTTCYACVRVCPVGNEPMTDIVDLRRELVFDGRAPDALAEVLRSLDEKGNSFGESARRRPRWTRGLPFKIPDARKQPVEYLWFVGDFASYDPQAQAVSRQMAAILTGAGVDFGILYEGECSAGNDVRRAGEEGLFDSLAERNLAALEGCEYRAVFTTDPHTFNTLRNEYGGRGLDREVLHYATLLERLLRDGRITVARPLSGRATYHDPCYLGRYNGGFDAPRQVLRATGLQLVEMPRNRENSFCCGAGGGRIWLPDHDDVRERPSENRIREALDLGQVEQFVVACPKDLTMYRDAVKSTGNEGRITVVDLAELVARASGIEAAAD